ncbi:MAG TPA: SIMPL domain-containing protein [Candidatus Levybacteria bacterium]|nr:SIMPL domain-containing protein [Candidatus Levybacteria bacterium]
MIKVFFKNYLLSPICYIVLTLITLFILNQFSYFNISLSSNNNYNTFEVIGTGKVTAAPNIATTLFTIEEKGTTQEQAKNSANAKQNQAIKDLTALGIPKANIKTTGFFVNPNFEDETLTLQAPARRVQQGYIATVTTQVKGENVDQINKAIDKLTALGINVGGVEYQYKDKQQYVNEAQDKAIANAKEQAQNIAKAAGFKLGKIVTVRNAANDGQYQPYSSEAMNLTKTAPDTNTQLQPGENEITSQMGVTYYIRN